MKIERVFSNVLPQIKGLLLVDLKQGYLPAIARARQHQNDIRSASPFLRLRQVVSKLRLQHPWQQVAAKENSLYRAFPPG